MSDVRMQGFKGIDPNAQGPKKKDEAEKKETAPQVAPERAKVDPSEVEKFMNAQAAALGTVVKPPAGEEQKGIIADILKKILGIDGDSGLIPHFKSDEINDKVTKFVKENPEEAKALGKKLAENAGQGDEEVPAKVLPIIIGVAAYLWMINYCGTHTNVVK